MIDAEKELKRLMRDITELREKLEKLIVQKHWDLLDSEVLSFSQKLNILMVQYSNMLDDKISVR